MNRPYLLICLCVCLLLSCGAARAHLGGAIGGAPPVIDTLVADSDIIAEVTVDSVDYDPSSPAKDVMDFICVKSGSYVLTPTRSIKGDLTKTITVAFPKLYGFTSGSLLFGFGIAPPKQGDTLLVFLKQQSGGYVPTNTARPYCPILPAPSFLNTNGDPRAMVLTDLSCTMNDPKLRRFTSSVLKYSMGPDIVEAMAKYINDSNESVKDNVLTCMAVNSQVAAIPMIADLAEAQAGKGGAFSVNCLADYTTEEAVPYLNPLLCSRLYSVRDSTLRALNNLGDASSAPYLILELHDPANNYELADAAHMLFAKIVLHKAQPYEDRTQFLANRETELGQDYAWWGAELLGLHLSKDPVSVVEQQLQAAQPMPNAAAAIDPLLFQPYPALRERAIKALQTTADDASVPYLILALQDPDSDVSYGAYVMLNRLLGRTPTPRLTEADYRADQEMATKPLYAWWSDRLIKTERE